MFTPVQLWLTSSLCLGAKSGLQKDESTVWLPRKIDGYGSYVPSNLMVMDIFCTFIFIF